MSQTKQNRNDFIDLSKGVAIILVVLGHCVQFGSGKDFLATGAFFYDSVFKFIYSFHMPLFMAISGYLFHYSLKRRNWHEVIKSKITGLLIPLIAWPLVFTLLSIFLESEPVTIRTFIYYSRHALWFIWALLFCSIVALCVKTILHDRLWAHLALFVIFLFIPYNVIPEVFIFMYPYFILGYWFNKYQIGEKLRQLSISRKLCIYLSGVAVYAIMFWHYQHDYYIYISGTCLFNRHFSILQMCINDAYRFIIGLIGTSVCLSTLHAIYPYLKQTLACKLMKMLGTATLSLYALNTYINETILIRLPYTKPNYLLNIIEAILFLAFGYAITLLLRKSSITRKLFLGGR